MLPNNLPLIAHSHHVLGLNFSLLDILYVVVRLTLGSFTVLQGFCTEHYCRLDSRYSQPQFQLGTCSRSRASEKLSSSLSFKFWTRRTRSVDMSLPVLNLSKYTRGSPQEQEQFSQDLLRSFQAYGFVKIINHGFESDYIDELMSWVGRLALVRLNGNFADNILPVSEPSFFQIRFIHQSFHPQSKRRKPPTRV